MKHYLDIHGWFGYEKTYDFLIKSIPENGTFVECGAWLGKSSNYLCEIANKKNINVFIVDSWKGSQNELENAQKMATEIDIFEVFKENMDGKKYTAIREYSLDACKIFENESLDVVFIDMEHTYKSVMQDIQAWLPKVKKNGYLAGHDYSDFWPEVKKAVVDKFVEFDIIDDCWIHHKK